MMRQSRVFIYYVSKCFVEVDVDLVSPLPASLGPPSSKSLYNAQSIQATSTSAQPESKPMVTKEMVEIGLSIYISQMLGRII
jgi:hypothetical protein